MPQLESKVQGFYLPVELLEQVRQYADQENRSISNAVVQLLKTGLKKAKN